LGAAIAKQPQATAKKTSKANDFSNWLTYLDAKESGLISKGL